MNKKDLMLRQIDVDLKQENAYLKDFNEQLKDPNLVEVAKERIIMLRDATMDSIDRHKRIRLRYV